jgi:hypothetical protein
LNYLGCFLTPSDDQLKKIQTLLDNFALKGQNISNSRRYLPLEQGGVGLFNIHDFLIAQKCSWVKRAFLCQNDNWRLSLAMAAPDGNIGNVRSCDIDPNRNLILFELAAAFEFFFWLFLYVRQ